MRDVSGIEYDLDCIRDSGLKVVIWGAGRYGRYIYRYLKRCAVHIQGIIDKRQEIDIPGGRIMLQQLDNIGECLFVIAARWKEEKLEIKKQLLDYGVSPAQLVIPVPDIGSEFFDPSLTEHPDFLYPVIAARWRYFRQEGSHIVNYFEQNDLYRIGVYEIKEFEGWLEQDLEWSDVSVCQWITNDCAIDGSLDAIVVMDMVCFDYIEEQIMLRTKCPVIGIMEILR